MNKIRLHLLLSSIVVAGSLSAACTSTSAEGEGEGAAEGEDEEGEGEGEEGEGEEGEGEEGEGEEGEGEEGEGEEGEGEVPAGNERDNPIEASLPFTETVAIPNTEVCYRVTASEDGFIRAGATTANCAARSGTEDVRLVVLINGEVFSDDDGGIGYCTYLDVAVTAGAEVVVCFNEGGGGGFGNPIAAADVFIEETTGPLPLDALCRNDASFGEPPYLACEQGLGCFDNNESGATACLVAVVIGIGEPCDPDAQNEICDAPLEDDVKCRSDGTTDICSAVTILENGEDCAVASEIATCGSGLQCLESVCANPLFDQCVAASPLEPADDDGDGVFTNVTTLNLVAGPGLACGFADDTQSLRYVAAVDGLVRVERDGFGSIAVFAEDCIEQTVCVAGNSETTFEVTAGQGVVVFVDSFQTNSVEVTISNAARVEIGDGQACPDTFNESCESGLFCGSGLTCQPPQPLDVPGSIEFDVAIGELLCVAVTLDGPTVIETSGACENGGDSRVFVFQDGVEVAVDDDGGESLCSLLTRNFEAGEYVVCVEELRGDEALTGTLTIN